MGDMIPTSNPVCGERWTELGVEGPHGCILEPGHVGSHLCTCVPRRRAEAAAD